MSIVVSYVNTGRRKQKERTRTSLIDAARRLLASGFSPTVEEAAEAASVSRATAYRYFSSQQELLVAAHPEVETASLLGPAPSENPSERIDAVVLSLSEIFLGAKASYRAMLRMSLNPDPATRGELSLRQGRRFLWIEDALRPVRNSLKPEMYDRLVNAIAAIIGIEALVVLIDLGGLKPAEAVDVMRWSARALVDQALKEANIS